MSNRISFLPTFRPVTGRVSHSPFHRTVIGTVAASVTALALAACSSGGAGQSGSALPTTGTDGTTAASGDTALADLQKAGVLTIATEGTYAPFSYHDEKSGDLTGYDVDVITAVAQKLGVTPKFNEVKWDGIFAGLEAGRYDVIANQVGATDERKAKYDFSTVYSVSNPVVIVNKDNTSVKTIADVKGLKSAQSVTSNYAQLAKDAGAEIVPVDGFTEAVAAIKDKRVDVTFNDDLAVLDYLKNQPDAPIKAAFTIEGASSGSALALRKDSGLVPAIDKALADLKADGTLAKLGQKYFGKDISGTAK